MKLLFASIHSYLDPSSGAALATRELLELLACRGMDCRVFAAGVLDYERETSLEEVLASLELPAQHLHNFGYNDRRFFQHVSAMLFPSEYSRRYHNRALGLDGAVIAYPIPLDRVIAENAESTYVTYINPQLSKGVTVFARIAMELHVRRPDIPLLVVEGRGTSNALGQLPVDLSSLTNLNRMANTPDPRDFYRLSRVVLMPSLWRESFGRVAVEAMANGIPVLASDRGALPETLGDAGFVFTVPERCTPQSLEIPTASEVAPCVAAIEKLWDDPAFEARHRELARAEARRWVPARVGEQFEHLFRSLSS